MKIRFKKTGKTTAMLVPEKGKRIGVIKVNDKYDKYVGYSHKGRRQFRVTVFRFMNRWDWKAELIK